MITGVYRIYNKKNGKSYIGSATNISARWLVHRRQLDHTQHHSIKLQRAWNKYGAENFTFEILEQCSELCCLEREQFYLNTLLFASFDDDRFDKLGYNICRVANKPPSWSGKNFSHQHKLRISQAQAGSNNPMWGRQHSINTKEKIRQSRLGRCFKLNQQQIDEIKELILCGIKRSEILVKYNISQSTLTRLKNRY